MKVKKVICIFLVVMQALSLCVSAQVDENSSEAAMKLVDLMTNLSIYEASDEMANISDSIAREKFAVILSKFYGLSKDTGAGGKFQTEFSDVPDDYWAAEHIMMVTQNGLMSEYTDGLFRPQKYVTFEQATKAFVVLLGYKLYAEQSGGWPNGYLIVAEQQKIMKDINKKNSDYITKGELTKMLYNSLDVKVMKQTSYGGTNTYATIGETLLNEMLDIYKITDVIKATDITGLLGETAANSGKVKIGDIILETNSNLNEYLGINSTVYYKQTEDMDYGELLYINESKNKNEIVTVKSEDINSDTTTTNFSYVSENKNKNLVLPIGTSVIFNGKQKTFFNKNDLMPMNGTVRLIDADKDGKFETVIVENYIDYWVDYTYFDNGILNIFDKRTNIAPLTIDMEGNNKIYMTGLDGKNVDYSKIIPKCIISVAADKMNIVDMSIQDTSTIYKIIITEKTKTGVIEAISSTDRTVIMDGESYAISVNYNYIEAPLNIGDDVIFYFNSQGEIVARLMSDGYNYGFITNVKSQDVFNNVFEAKIFTSNNSFEIIECAKNVKIDNQTYKGDKILQQLKNAYLKFCTDTQLSMENSTGVEQLVRYSLNNNKITEIDTVLPNYQNEDSEKNCFNFGSLYQTTDSNQLYFSTYTGVMQKDNFTVGIDNDVIYFLLPKDLNDEKSYSIRNASTFSDDIKNNICFFDVDEIGYAKVLLELGRVNQETVRDDEYNNMMIVESITSVLNSEEEPTKLISGVKIKSGEDVKLYMSESAILEKIPVKPGDIISWNENNLGYATAIRKVMSPDGSGSILTPENPATTNESGNRIIYAKVIDKSDKFWKLQLNGTTSWEEVGMLSPIKNLFLFDNSKKDKISKCSLDALKTVKDFGANNASKVFILNYDTRHLTTVIYN